MLPAALGVGGGWMGVGVGWGVPLTQVHMHAHTCTHTHAHIHVKYDNFNCKWQLPLGESLGIPYDVICVCTCMCMCACVCSVHVWLGGATSHHVSTPIHPPPTPQEGDPRNQSKFNSTWTNQDISILFKDLKSVETSPPMGGCIVWWVDGWFSGSMGGVRSNTKNLINLDLIEIIQFCLKIYHL